MSPEELFTKVAPSVFVVSAIDPTGASIGFGSGVATGPNSIVTSKHVVTGAKLLLVKHRNGSWPGRITHMSPAFDLCQLEIEGLEASPVSVRESSSLVIGERVYAVGAPKGYELTISEGLVSGLRKQGAATTIQTTAPISHGSSGGGLFDCRAQLVGIITYFIRDGQSINFALPADLILDISQYPFREGTDKIEDTEQESPSLEDLASQRMKRDQYAEAIELLRKALELRPENDGSWASLGYCYKRVKLLEEAVEAYRKAVSLRPDSYFVWVSLADAYQSMDLNDQAIEACREAIRIKPDLNHAWIDLGRTYSKSGEHDRALEALREAIRLNPDFPFAWHSLGTAYVWKNQFDQALPAMQQAVRLDPDNAIYWLFLGAVYHNLKDEKNVRRVYERLRELDPRRAKEFHDTHMRNR